MSTFRKLSAIASLVCAGATAAAAQVPTVDWKKQEAEILRHHRALVQIDTSPPSHEKVDDYLTQVLEAEGIPVKLANTGNVLLSGDLYHYPEEITYKKVPNFDTDRKQTAKSREKIEEFVKQIRGSTCL